MRIEAFLDPPACDRYKACLIPLYLAFLLLRCSILLRLLFLPTKKHHRMKHEDHLTALVTSEPTQSILFRYLLSSEIARRLLGSPPPPERPAPRGVTPLTLSDTPVTPEHGPVVDGDRLGTSTAARALELEPICGLCRENLPEAR